MSGTPFFETIATTTQVTGIKRCASEREKGLDLLHNDLDMLVRTKKDQFLPLSELRDLLMDHILETIETDLKHTVFLICDEVTDFRTTSTNGVYQTEIPSNSFVPFLDISETTSRYYQLRSKIGEGDSIPRCDSILLKMPTSKREMENEKKMAKKSIKKRIKQYKKCKSGGSTDISADFYILNSEERRVHLGAIPFENPQESGYVVTEPLSADTLATRTPESLLVAIDCEMCRTTKGVELTRITLVDANENVLIDEFVRPANEIIDYCTQYSGITQDIMDNCTNTLTDIQARVLSLLPADAILIGHSIENDLQALKLVHFRIIDTTILYPHPKGPPFRSALRFLTSMYLNRTIQTGTNGHCSVEDAIATLQLAQLKIKKGPMFPSIQRESDMKKVINELSTNKKSVLIVDSIQRCRSMAIGNACTIPCETNGKVIQNVVHQLTTGFPPHLTWSRVSKASRVDLIEYIKTIRSALPPKSLFVVLVSGDTTALREMHKLRTSRSDVRSTFMWEKSQQLELDVLASRTQEGLAHVFIQ